MNQDQKSSTFLKITWASVGGKKSEVGYATMDFLEQRHVGVSFTEEVPFESIPAEWKERIMYASRTSTNNDSSSTPRNKMGS